MKNLGLSFVLAATLALVGCQGGGDSGSTTGTGQMAQLTVSKSGGLGTVTSTPGDIDCGAVCDQAFDAGTTVTLSAAPAANYKFVGWSGTALNCANSETCAVTLEAEKSVTATFSPLAAGSVDLSLTIAGAGKVTSDLGGLNCSSDCLHSFALNTTINLTATPVAGSVFAGWSGSGVSCTTSICKVEMSSARSVTATFTAAPTTQYFLNVAVTGLGGVGSVPSGINACTGSCSSKFNAGTSVTLTALPGSGYSFGGWGGGVCSGTATSCTVVMSAARTVTALFNVVPVSTSYALTAAVVGSGTVTSSPSGITCPTTCSKTFNAGTAVTLTATPAAGYRLKAWSGACSGTATTCAVTVSVATNAGATFEQITYPLSVSKTGTGTVTSVPAGIACGATCSANYSPGTAVTLTAVPPAGVAFNGWGGACSGTGTCSVTLNAASSVTAAFVSVPSYAVTVTKAGTGSGSVTTADATISCGSTCSASYNSGTAVTLTATASSGSTFAGWSGGVCTGTSTCSTNVTAARAITATFNTTAPTDTTAPTVSAFSPDSAASNVLTTSVVSVNFSEAVKCSSVTASSFTVSGVAGTVSCSGSNAVFTPTAALAYSTTYTVQLSTAVTDLAGNALGGTRSASFTTTSAPATGEKFSFLAYGDSRSGNGCGGNTIHQNLVTRMVAEPAAFVFNLGDMVTGYDKSTNWVQRGDCPSDAAKGSFKEIIAPLQNKAPAAGLPTYYFPVVGNHDDNFGDGWYPDKFGNGFCDVFDPKKLIPNHTQSHAYFQDWTRSSIKHYSDAEFYPLACSKTPQDVYPDYMYYSFDYMNSHFVVMRVNSDYYNLMDCSSGCTDQTNYDNFYYKHQLDWLRYDLAQASTKSSIKNIFVLTHAPLITYSDGHSANTSWPLLLKEFSKYNAKIVFSGHNHVYERSVPVYATDANPGGVRDDVRGTVYAITGGGGSDPHGFRTLGALNAKATNAYHYMRIDVDGTTINVKAIGQDGSVVDSFTR